MTENSSGFSLARGPPGSSTSGPGDGKTFDPKKNLGSGSGSGGIRGSGSGRDGLSCPKCGDPCVHVETFVCKRNRLYSDSF